MNEPMVTPAIRASLRGNEPTAEQWAALSHPLVPVHLIAGAGSGKTAIMAARIAWAIESRGYEPSQILGLTFTNKAAEELEERVRGAVSAMEDRRPDEITVQTYHAFAASIVRDHGLLVGVESEAGLLTEAQQWQLVLSCMDALPAFEAIELRSSAGIVRATLALAGSLSDHIISLAEIEAAADRVIAARDADDKMRTTALQRKELCGAVAAYVEAKARFKRIDFGDQVTKAVEILEGHAEIRQQYRERFPVVLLDEYQDTNVAQRRLIQALVGDGGAVTAVGDARQAIYAFRGATMYNLIGFPDHFPRSEGERYAAISLSENFRSGAKILEVANRIVAGIDPARRPGVPLRPQPSNGDGSVALGLFADERSEAAWIADRCEAFHGTSVAEGRPEVRWRDLAILVRRKASMDALIEALDERDIPVEVVGLGGLLKTPEVIEVVAWLRCLETKPSSNRWLARVLLGPRWRIHYRDLAACARWAAGRNVDLRVRLAGGDPELAYDLDPGDVGFALIEALDHLDDIEGLGEEAKSRLAAFRERITALRSKISGPLLDLVQEVIDVSGIDDALEASSSRTAPAAKQNIANFLDYVAAFAPVAGEATLRSLIEYLDAAEDAEETLESAQPAESDSVKLMTVHGAKGLEFECVFVPSVAAKKNKQGEHVYSIFPNERTSNPLTSYRELPYEVREDAGHLPQWSGKLSAFSEAVKERVREDERRLFYVALTRAKQRLAVTAAWWYGRDRTEKGPSLFWEELRALEDEGLVKVVREDEQAEANPIIDDLEGRRRWPPPARAEGEDPLFPEGPGPLADRLVAGEIALESLLEELPADERDAASSALTAHLEQLRALGRRDPHDHEARPPQIVSATSYVALVGGEVTGAKLDRPVPERPSSDRYLGTEIHRLIEERSLELDEGVMAAPYPDEAELDEPLQPGEADAIRMKLEQWAALGYPDRRLARLESGLPMVELPFAAKIDGQIVRGRIDAVFTTEDGGFEIVDYKSGKRFEPGEVDQLGVYARALVAAGAIPADVPVRLTYAFLDGEPPLTREWTG